MNAEGNRIPGRRTNLISECKRPLELLVQRSLGDMGIDLLSEWDALVFVFRHGACLISADQIARLLGYDIAVTGRALDRLERQNLVACSRLSQGVRFYRIQASMEAGRPHCFEQLISLSESRSGRVLLAGQLTLTKPRTLREQESAKLGR
jgi:DNA-binding MarR family transcriptional regulator